MDGILLLYVVLGGVFMGTYPVPIKSKAVLRARVHPIVFQCYKSFWVFVTGFIFIGLRAIRGDSPIFAFSWWGVVSAVAWIPSGLTTILSVPMIGMGMAVVVSTGTGAVSSFLVFWLVFGEQIKKHHLEGSTVYLAPLWLVCILVGMAGLTYAPQMKLSPSTQRKIAEKSDGTYQKVDEEIEVVNNNGEQEAGGQEAGKSVRFILGISSSVCGGLFSSLQYGLVTTGKHYEEDVQHCRHTGSCPAILKEEFNGFGSWLTSFGIGAALGSLFWLLLLHVYQCWFRGGYSKDSARLTSFHLDVMAVPGTVAGLCWCLGNFFNTIAVMRGGNAIVMPQLIVVQMLTSGAWGMLYYREMHLRNALVWCAWAAWTTVFMILLGLEKVE
jgi:hypothetical protein